ncbi:hypothetical protein FHS85_002280 [Rhodoligotrophos appendicifer]|uniref:sensor histidine kinase n=1 Tax=Rhodoligotrophos appendicifer TaxID=987056 RepID=UPI001186B9BF|nr:GAF domain-containing sensor histidine kinase [Rhodoligotrophos appendicifer]
MTAEDISETEEVQRDLALIAGIEAVPKILDVVCGITGMGFAAVARVTGTRWLACAVRDDIGFGLGAGEQLPLKTTLCDEIRISRSPVVVDNFAEDEHYRDHHTPATYGLQSYISFPIIRANGEVFGTLCAVDPGPASISKPEIKETFRLFAELIAFHLDAADRIAVSEAALIDAKEAAVLREQFVAVLGHDLRNSVAAIQGGARLLEKRELDEKGRYIVQQVGDSARRMERLISDVLDFARGRLGGGIALNFKPKTDVRALIERVVNEVRMAWPDRHIAIGGDAALSMTCDPERISQLLSNLLANAISHGSPDGTVEVEARFEGDSFALSVANSGKPIAADALPQLFQPFKRRSEGVPQAGLGLGLYIASSIAKGHGGRLDVASTPARTSFRLVIPRDQAQG